MITDTTNGRVTLLEKLSQNLSMSSDGIWKPKRASSRDISYPRNGHIRCTDVEAHSFWFEHRNDVIGCMVKAHVCSGNSIFLDVGGGTGFVSSYLEKEVGLQTVVMEPDPVGAAAAKVRGIRYVAESTLDEAGFEERSFDAIGLFDVIEHVFDDLGLLRTCNRLIPDEGRVFITVPAFNWLWSTADDRAGHFRRYTLSHLELKLREAKLEPLFISYYFSTIVLPLFFFRTLPYRLLRRGDCRDESIQRHHATRSTLTRDILRYINSLELRRIGASKMVPIGTSIVCVARKQDV